MLEHFAVSDGEIEVEAVRAAVITFPDESLMIVLDGGQNLFIAPAGMEDRGQQAVKTWKAFRADYEAPARGKPRQMKDEPGALKAIMAAIDYPRTCPSQPTKYAEEDGIRHTKKGRRIAARGTNALFAFTRARLATLAFHAAERVAKREE